MKKLLFTATLILISVAAFSQKIKATSGSVDFLKNEKSILAKFTYENMTVGKMSEEAYVKDKVAKINSKEPGRGDTWHKNWTNDRAERYEPQFIELFNKYMGEKSRALIGNDGSYTMVVNTHFSEPGFNVGVARKRALVDLTCTFVCNETNEELAVIIVEGASARDFWGTDFDTGYRLQESYAKAGRELANFLVKSLK